MYCSEIWGNIYVTNTQCIILKQKRMIRLIHGTTRRDHANNYFYNYRILKYIVDIVDIKLFYLCLMAVVMFH